MPGSFTKYAKKLKKKTKKKTKKKKKTLSSRTLEQQIFVYSLKGFMSFFMLQGYLKTKEIPSHSDCPKKRRFD
jgi:hypothetical protein